MFKIDALKSCLPAPCLGVCLCGLQGGCLICQAGGFYGSGGFNLILRGLDGPLVRPCSLSLTSQGASLGSNLYFRLFSGTAMRLFIFRYEGAQNSLKYGLRLVSIQVRPPYFVQFIALPPHAPI